MSVITLSVITLSVITLSAIITLSVVTAVHSFIHSFMYFYRTLSKRRECNI